jgi:ribosomal protein S18 acetylase RimI-like enzyme
VDDLRIQPMTAAEFGEVRSRLIRDFAADQVRAGAWAAADAEDRAASQTDGLLPQGVRTPGMLLLTAQAADGTRIGHVWIALQHPDAGQDAWIYDIEIAPEQRGRGYGRALLAAAARAAAPHGARGMGLNVFGPNAVARGLYESAGYEITTMQLRKELAREELTGEELTGEGGPWGA